MIAIDTNVLVRILIDDDNPEQIAAARGLAAKAKCLFIAQIVQIELVWVLKRAYEISKPVMLTILNELLENEAFCLQHPEVYKQALKSYAEGTADFSDCILLAECKHKNINQIFTFDKKSAKFDSITLLHF